MGGKSSPPPPDYVGASIKQAEINQESAREQNYANRGTTTTPWGSLSYSPSVVKDPITGKEYTTYDQSVTLDPDEQAALDAQQSIQMGRSGAAETLLGQATQNFQTPMDWNSLPSRAGTLDFSRSSANPYTQQAFSFGPQVNLDTSGLPQNIDSGYRQKAQDATMALMQPMLDRRRAAEQTRALNEGFTRGSEGFEGVMSDVSDAENRAMLQAIDSGRAEAGLDLQAGQQAYNQSLGAMQFGNQAQQQAYNQAFQTGQAGNQASQLNYQNLMQSNQDWLNQQMAAGAYQDQLRKGAISEEQLRRGMTLNELNALLSGQQVSMPGFQSQPAASVGQGQDLMGALQQQYGAELGASNASNAARGNTTAAAGGIASAAIMAIAF